MGLFCFWYWFEEVARAIRWIGWAGVEDGLNASVNGRDRHGFHERN